MKEPNKELIKRTEDTFLKDIVAGLSKTQKRLDPKYFYDERGHALFQKIMHMPEYYLTDCELEILTRQKADITDICFQYASSFDVVELGAGDALKSIFILEHLAEKQGQFNYYPIDISQDIITHLEDSIPQRVPSIRVKGMAGEYFKMLRELQSDSSKKKLVLFLGSSVGNMQLEESTEFLKKLNQFLNPGDLLLTGFDLIKNPELILKAYNDRQGNTKAFNFNLLSRINKELNADFKLENFSHFPTYNPQTGACESYLISLTSQDVTIADHKFGFEEGETIFMEISQKFNKKETDSLAEICGFKPIENFYDHKEWFLDALWMIR